MHVVSAVLSIGPLFILMPIIRRLRGVEASIEQAYLSIINVIIRLVMHAGHVLVLQVSCINFWTLAMVYVMGCYDFCCHARVCSFLGNRLYNRPGNLLFPVR